MDIGVPRERRSHESRVGLTPAGVELLTAEGHNCYVESGAGVVTTRNHVRYVATEHGIADLCGKTLRQRARALIDVAHPQFREELEKAAYELKYL